MASSSKCCCIVYTCICLLRFLLNNIFFNYIHIFKIGKITKEEKNSLKSVSQVFKILFQTGDFKTFVLRGVVFSKYVQLKSSFSGKKMHQR